MDVKVWDFWTRFDVIETAATICLWPSSTWNRCVTNSRYCHAAELPHELFPFNQLTNVPLFPIGKVLQLRSNNLTAFPQQFLRPFPRLRHLDLANNRLNCN